MPTGMRLLLGQVSEEQRAVCEQHGVPCEEVAVLDLQGGYFDTHDRRITFHQVAWYSETMPRVELDERVLLQRFVGG